MDNKTTQVIHLTIIGKGTEVDKIQKRLRCAARATGSELQLSWQHEPPQNLFKKAKHAIAVSHDNELLIDGLMPTEEIEILFKELTENSKNVT